MAIGVTPVIFFASFVEAFEEGVSEVFQTEVVEVGFGGFGVFDFLGNYCRELFVVADEEEVIEVWEQSDEHWFEDLGGFIYDDTIEFFEG